MAGKILLFIPWLLAPQFLPGQSISSNSARMGASYFSEGGLNPGFILTYERSLLTSHRFEIVAAAKGGAYFHYQNQTGIFLMIQSGQRIRLYRSLFFEHYLGIGYLHTFLNGGDAYYVDSIGKIHKSYDTGNPHFMPSISFGLSYVMQELKGQPRLFIKPIIFWQIPFNETSLVQYGLEIGGIIKLGP
ncbi:MAG TPA: hypothetical protein VFW11_21905 [Cyclobacteriaceae bacterium]|nr:hypothetical protein [Cyclobacteriaceae bacterium]